MPTLYSSTSNDDITLSRAIEKCAAALSHPSEGIALLYSRSSCQFAKVQKNGNLTSVKGEKLDIEDIFEARVFNQASELRWLNNLNGKGQAVLLSEELNIANYLDNSIPNLTDLYTIKQEYILWGETVAKTLNSGWSQLAKSQIGSLYVPVNCSTANKRIYLTAVEYLKADEEYGNVSVVEERLTGLEVR